MERAFESAPEKEPYGLGVALPSLEEEPTFLTVICREVTRKKCLPPCDIVDLLIFACLDFREFAMLGLFVKSNSRIINFDDSIRYYNDNFREITKFANLSSSQNSRKLKNSRILPDLQYT